MEIYLLLLLLYIGVCCTTLVGILKCMGFWMQLLQVQLMPVSVPIQPWQVNTDCYAFSS